MKTIFLRIIQILNFLLIFLSQEFLFSQPSLLWVKQYNGSGVGNDVSNSIAVDDSGNVYVTGESSSSLNTDYSTIKYNSSGIQQWVSRYNGTGNGQDNAVKICLDKKRNVYVTGSSRGAGSNQLDITTIKYNNSGAEQWVSRYNFGTSNERGMGMCLDSLGNVYVTGYSTGSNTLIRTIKYDSSGNQIWLASFDGPSTGVNTCKEIIMDKYGDLLICGYSDSDYVVIKYNAAGVEQWASFYPAPAGISNFAQSIETDRDANVLVTGYSSGPFSPNWITVKYNPGGTQLWAKVETGSGSETYDYARDLVTDDFGNVYVTGSTTTAIKLGADVTTRKYNSAGNLTWIKKFFRISVSESGVKIAKDKLGNVIVAAYSNSEFLTLKYDPAGNLIWNTGYGRSFGNDVPNDMVLDNSGNIYLTGYITDSLSNSDYGTLKYSDIITSVNPVQAEIPVSFSLEQNYPNPFNPVTNIKFSIPSSGNISLVVYDGLGREVAELADGFRSAGTYEIDFDASQLSSGMYFYKLVSDGFTDTKKMTLVK